MPPRAILFDLFDTLVDLFILRLPPVEIDGRPVPSTYGALYETIVQRIELDFESFARELGAVDREVRTRLQNEGREYPTLERFGELLRRLGTHDPELAEKLTRTHMGKLRDTAAFVSHHPEVVRQLRKSARIGICSNFSHAPTAHALIDEASLSPHLDAVVISEEIGIRKPRREIFEAALGRLGVSAAETIHVGDNLKADVAGAAALGITTVWITRRVSDPEQALELYEGPAPTHVIRDLSELQSLL